MDNSIKPPPLRKDRESEFQHLVDHFISDPYLNNTFKGKRVSDFMDFLLETADQCGDWITHYGCIGGSMVMFYVMIFNTEANSWHVVIMDVKEVIGVNSFGQIEVKEAPISCICSLPIDKINATGKGLLELFKQFEENDLELP